MLGVGVGPESAEEGMGGFLAHMLTPAVRAVFIVSCIVQGFLLALTKNK